MFTSPPPPISSVGLRETRHWRMGGGGETEPDTNRRAVNYAVGKTRLCVKSPFTRPSVRHSARVANVRRTRGRPGGRRARETDRVRVAIFEIEISPRTGRRMKNERRSPRLVEK